MRKNFLIKPTSQSFEKLQVNDRTLCSFSVQPFNFQGEEITNLKFNNLIDDNMSHVSFRGDLLNNELHELLLLNLEENDLEVEVRERFGIRVVNLVCRSEEMRGNWYTQYKDFTFRPVPNEVLKQSRNNWLTIKIQERKVEEDALIAPTINTLAFRVGDLNRLTEIKEWLAEEDNNSNWIIPDDLNTITLTKIDLSKVEVRNGIFIVKNWEGIEITYPEEDITENENDTDVNNNNEAEAQNSSDNSAANVQEILGEGSQLANSSDWNQMEEIIKKLKNIRDNGSAEEKEEFGVWGGDLVIQDLERGVNASKPKQNNQNGNNNNQKPNNEEINRQAQEEMAREDENTRNSLNDGINQARNGDSDKKAKVIKNSGKVFGNQTFEQQETEIKVIEDELFEEDPEKYRQAIIDKVKNNLVVNNLSEGEFKIADQTLEEQWKKVENGEIKDKNQIREVSNKVNKEIVQTGAEKILTDFKNQIQQVLQTNDQAEIQKLRSEIVKFIERIKNNIYTGNALSQSQSLLEQIENYNQTPSANPDKFPWIPVSIFLVVAVALIAIGLLVVKSKRKNKIFTKK